MRKKLSNQSISIAHGLGEQQNSGGKAVDAMHNQGSSSASFERVGEERQRGWCIRAWNRYGQKSGRFIHRNECIILVQDGKLTPLEIRTLAWAGTEFAGPLHRHQFYECNSGVISRWSTLIFQMALTVL
jgi:hypothetical protein